MFQKNYMDNISSKRQKRQRLAAFIFVNTIQYPCTLKNSIYNSNKRGLPPFPHSDTNPVLGQVLVPSVDKTHVLIVTVELIWLLFLNIISFNVILRLPAQVFLFKRLVYSLPTAMSSITGNHAIDLFYLLKKNFKNLII